NLRLRRVTASNTTFIELNSEFSSDVSTHVLEDARFKHADQFKAIKQILTRSVGATAGAAAAAAAAIPSKPALVVPASIVRPPVVAIGPDSKDLKRPHTNEEVVVDKGCEQYVVCINLHPWRPLATTAHSHSMSCPF